MFLMSAVSAVALAFSGASFAEGTADEAKAMLTKAVAAVKADKAKALDMFNKGEGGFLVGDLYVFCANASDGKIIALANTNAKQLIGTDQRALKDSTGKAYGDELYAAAQCRSARTLLSWSLNKLASAASVPANVIHSFEMERQRPDAATIGVALGGTRASPQGQSTV
jgi:hypothetical protein